jgi:hypothetical protein
MGGDALALGEQLDGAGGDLCCATGFERRVAQ